MSRTVDPREVWGPGTKSLRGALTDWRAYCDGQAHELVRGTDLPDDVPVASKRSSFRQWAKRNGFDMAKVHTALPDDETLVIWIEDAGEPEVPVEERIDGLRPHAVDRRRRASPYT